ncbi:MAG: hypothetical protein H6837_00070 [Planctomycetes bacterium]|nr:hypothetical protein [Planctomycetota bacterium]
MTSRLPGCSLLLCAALSALSPLESVTAQAPSGWRKLAITGTVVPANFLQRGKILAYRDGTALRVYSALTRSFAVTTASAAATIRYANDVLVVVDGTRFSAFASYTGQFATLNLGANAQLVNPPSQGNDSIFLALDGTDLWSFSGFFGTWQRITVAASAQIAVQRHVAVVADGTRALGLSAFHDTWQQLTLTSAATMVAADGTVGVLASSGQVHGFSALRNGWSSNVAPSAAALLTTNDDLAVWSDGTVHLGFSGLRGTFASQVLAGAQATQSSEQVAFVQATNGIAFYSPVTASWTTLPLTGTASVTTAGSLAMVVEAGRVSGFSALRGAVVSRAFVSTRTGNSGIVGLALDNLNRGALFSAQTGTWTDLPSNQTGAPQIATNGALVPVAGGVAAYSARDGKFHPITTGTAPILHAQDGSAILAVEDTGSLRVFEPRRAAWLEVKTSGQPLQVTWWRTAMVAIDGMTAFGYGAFHGRIEALALGAAPIDVNCGSESGRVATANTIAAFTALPILSTPWQTPEFRRTFAAGADLDLHLGVVPSTAQVYMAVAVTPSGANIPGLGEVFLDGPYVLPLVLSIDARTAVGHTRLPIPEVPGFPGAELFLQALVLPVSGQPFVTELASVYVR